MGFRAILAWGFEVFRFGFDALGVGGGFGSGAFNRFRV